MISTTDVHGYSSAVCESTFSYITYIEKSIKAINEK
jgi:hypothetical protein